MSKITSISWTQSTFNPWIGCFPVSAGCINCYARAWADRYGYPGLWGAEAGRHVTSKATWRQPIKWDRAATNGYRVFCGSLCDVFDPHPVAEETRPRLWELIKATPRPQWMVLTKRPSNISGMLPVDWGTGYPNVWLGVTVEHQPTAGRADILREIPAVKRFISYEPAIGPLILDLRGIDLVIYGGESGPHFRPDDVNWMRSIEAQCAAAGVGYHFKQRAAKRPGWKP